MSTTRRTVRVPDELWAVAGARAAELGTDLSSVIRQALEEFTSPVPRLTEQQAESLRGLEDVPVFEPEGCPLCPNPDPGHQAWHWTHRPVEKGCFS